MSKFSVNYLLTVGFLGCLGLCSFSPSDDPFESSVAGFFHAVEKLPQEKLYLHLDKPYYAAGENIWLAGYLVNAVTHRDDSRSNFITVELVDRRDTVVLRRKFRRDSTGFRGNLLLPADLVPGDYWLRGYSNWMRNAGPEFFYRRSLQIGNSIDTEILSSVERSSGGGPVRIRFYHSGGDPYPDVSVRYEIAGAGRKPVQGSARTDQAGYLSLDDDGLSSGPRIVSIRFDEQKYDYANTYVLPASSTDYDVAFFPEGGNLLSGVSQTVAFKAQGSDGFSLAVSGCVVGAGGDTVTRFSTEHDGMGTMVFTPSSGVSYKAVTRSASGMEKHFDLPAVRERGLGLSLARRNGSVFYQVNRAEGTPWPDSLYLVAHTRGTLRVLTPLTEAQATGRIDETLFADGISHFLLVDGAGRPLSERLLFIFHPEESVWTLTPDKTVYGRKEAVRLCASLYDWDGLPLHGRFSVSVTDDHTVTPDTLGGHILSDLLLTSDLKGYIENPGYYFLSPESPATQRHADLVMLTHGWRRFSTDHLLRAPSPAILHYIEVGQTVSGQVKNGFGKPVSDAKVLLYSADCFMEKETGKDGRFLVDSIQFRDSTTLVVQALTKKGRDGIIPSLDPDSFPEVSDAPLLRPDLVPIGDDYLEYARDRYFEEGGLRVMRLKEVVVTEKRPEKPKDPYVPAADKFYTSEDVPTALQHRTVYDYLRTLPGVIPRSGEWFVLRGNSVPPLILLDGVPFDGQDYLHDGMYMETVQSISILHNGRAAIFGIRGGGGVISIVTRRGEEIPPEEPPNIITARPLGYTEPAEFYSPAYDTPDKAASAMPDRRTTVYWNPSVSPDENGEIALEFYATDDPSSYRVTIEGVADDGTVCRYSGGLEGSSGRDDSGDMAVHP